MNRYATTLVLLVPSCALVAQDASPPSSSLPVDLKWQSRAEEYSGPPP